MHLPDRHFFPGMSFLSGILKRRNYLFILWLHSRNKKANNVGAKIKKIRSLRLHAARAYSHHIFEHKINVEVKKFTKKFMLNTSGCLVILISQ